jgi:hypothetical protein
MSYHILPKTNNHILIRTSITNTTESSLYISQSLYNYYIETKELLIKMCIIERDAQFTDLVKLINPYEYIFSKVPGSKYPVSKLKPMTNIFYELLEIVNTLSLQEDLNNNKSLHIGQHSKDSRNFFEFIQKDNTSFNNCEFLKINQKLFETIDNKRFDFIFCEIEKESMTSINLYILNLLRFLLVIFKNQANGGICIIKIDSLFHKPIVDMLYILSSFYEKICVIKPNISNVTTFEKYIVCKKFILDDNRIEACKQNYNTICIFLQHYNKGNIYSLINDDIPSYFLNKVNDINIIIGQQQLEAFDKIINMLNNKNKHDKVEVVKKANIQKSVGWCEKYEIPCNKFTDKTNIFLPLDDDDTCIDNEFFS